jgi:DNA-binding beta-propeller fold protein YncE
MDDEGSAATFRGPLALALRGDGTLYVAEQGSGLPRGIDPAGRVQTWRVTPEPGALRGLLPAPGGALYATTEREGLIVLAPGGTFSVLAAGDRAGTLSNPRGLALLPSGPLVVADTGSHTIRRVTPAGEVEVLAGGGSGFADGPLPVARFRSPEGVAVRPDGAVVVADTGNNAIRAILPGGGVSTLAGGREGKLDERKNLAMFRRPRGVAVDAAGNVFVADTDNHCIRRLTPDGTVTTLAGGDPGYQDGDGAAAKFRAPHAIAVDAAGTLYVADLGNHRIRRLAPLR